MATGIAAVGGRDLEIVIVVDVAGRAGEIGVSLGQRKTREGVIEISGIPTLGGVAIRAIGRGKDRARRGVRGVIGPLPGGKVAAGVAAIGWSDLEVVVVIDVARRAGNIGVAVGQREAGAVVIEFGVEPSIKGMARFASSGEVRRGVVGVGRFLEVFQVTGRAVRCESLELPDGRTLVTILALDSGVSSEQREAILVILDLLDRDLPA